MQRAPNRPRHSFCDNVSTKEARNKNLKNQKEKEKLLLLKELIVVFVPT